MHEEEDPRRGWQRVWQYVDREAARRGWSLEELYERTGVSETSFAKMRRYGEGLTRRDKISGVTGAFGWSAGSLDLIRSGGEPEPAPHDDVTPAAVAELLRRMGDAIGRLESLVDRIDDRSGPSAR